MVLDDHPPEFLADVYEELHGEELTVEDFQADGRQKLSVQDAEVSGPEIKITCIAPATGGLAEKDVTISREGFLDELDSRERIQFEREA